ncbi:hypothetical protein PHSY_000872 [Pseudozyma hubeiensis SY62]|uniref:Uncharacterized protein n=1 Tax=Pseudozyma hubeiensis (strain SY62) TaxID=1305764 RepID=R9NXL6_PSEHS|nr:hypothetical protein PHSY_000872 [Pseudozyma hubeiensis SY62]GAC93307.1 hypothetical protein PHSY_000872 [Pseudozyma hubeiensis SY62]
MDEEQQQGLIDIGYLTTVETSISSTCQVVVGSHLPPRNNEIRKTEFCCTDVLALRKLARPCSLPLPHSPILTHSVLRRIDRHPRQDQLRSELVSSMSIESLAKRQRTGDASTSSTKRSIRKAISTEQRQTIRHAQCLENGISALDRIETLRSGKADRRQIAWSSQNILATASNTRRSSTSSKIRSGHVVVQYPLASSSKSPVKPSCLYPDSAHFTFSSSTGHSQQAGAAIAASLTRTRPVRYNDPTQISFSPCGFYLCAYFTPHHSSSKAHHQPNASQVTSGQAATSSNDLAVPPLATSAETAAQISGNVSASDPTIAASQDASTSILNITPADRPPAVFCVWSRADTAALNDWKLVQTVPCDSTSSTGKRATSSKSDNVLKVDDKGRPVPTDTRQTPPSDGGSVSGASRLFGCVKQAVWLNRRRPIVLSPASSPSSYYGASSFTRLAARGPNCVASASASTDNSGPDQDVALVLFGNHGQVTLMCSRKTDRVAAANSSQNSEDAASPLHAQSAFFTTTLHSLLYTPSVQPSPITLDSAPDLGGDPAEDATSYTSPFSANPSEEGRPFDDEQEYIEDGSLTHLAIGMPANDSALLVASRRNTSSPALIDLTEITIDLRAETVTMITRPLQSASLSLSDYAQVSESADNGPSDGSKAPDLSSDITTLAWAEVGSTGSSRDNDASKSAGLRLVACSAYVEAFDTTADSAALGDTSSNLRTNVATWDLTKVENELSDAFASLECRKTGHAPKWLDWQLRFAQSKTLSNQLITSLVADAPSLVTADLALFTVLMPTRGESGLLSEHVGFVDLNSIDFGERPPSSVPVQALSRSSDPVVSSNGALFAMLSSTYEGASNKSIVLSKLPSYFSASSLRNANGAAEQVEEDKKVNELRMSQFLALACLRKTDPSDISRAFAADAARESAAKLLVEVGDLLKITESKRQDVLVKIEGATQKGPSHDSNSIPFHQALRLLKIRTAMEAGQDSSKSGARLEQLILELGLCFQVLRLARVKTEVTATPTQPAAESGKKKGGAAAAKATAPVVANEARERVYYQLESVWPLLAQLQWFLTLLDDVSKLALATSAVSGGDAGAGTADNTSKPVAQDSFESDFVRMLNKPTPRRLVLQILAHFCDFQEWVASTTNKDNLPPATGISLGDEANLSSSTGLASDGRLLAVSEQMALARDALQRVVGDASIDLADFAQLLVKIEADSSIGGTGGTASGPNQSRESDRFWWATLDGSKLDPAGGASTGKMEQDPAAGLQAKLLSSIVDPQSGALVDVLTLFVSPSDVLDERSVLYEKGALDDRASDERAHVKESALVKALSAMSAKRSDVEQRRDIVRKVSLSHAVTHNSILNDASTLLRSHPTTVIPASAASRLPPGVVAGNDVNSDTTFVRVSVMRAKRCLRCHALSQDPITATYALLPPPASAINPAAMMVDPNLPPQVQMQLQMQMMQMQMQLQQQQQQGGAAVQPGAVMPTMSTLLPLMQPQPKLLSIEVGQQGSSLDRFRFNCLCGGSWWVL